MGNFIECVRSREQPICNANVGHRSVTVCHLGNIAIRFFPDQTINWDPVAQRFTGEHARPGEREASEPAETRRISAAGVGERQKQKYLASPQVRYSEPAGYPQVRSTSPAGLVDFFLPVALVGNNIQYRTGNVQCRRNCTPSTLDIPCSIFDILFGIQPFPPFRTMCIVRPR